jgi:hypothetical protein
MAGGWLRYVAGITSCPTQPPTGSAADGSAAAALNKFGGPIAQKTIVWYNQSENEEKPKRPEATRRLAMALNKQIRNYDDCFKLFETALENKDGIDVGMGSKSSAMHMRARLHQARALDRAESRRLYLEENPKYDRSVFDGLVVRLKESAEGKWQVQIAPERMEILWVRPRCLSKPPPPKDDLPRPEE